MRTLKTALAAAALATLAGTALADVTIGVSLPLTGPASGLGIPVANYIKLWPKEIAGEPPPPHTGTDEVLLKRIRTALRALR